MSNELVTKQESQVAKWDAEKVKRIKELFIPKGVKDMDVAIFLEIAQQYDLSPAKKEVWIIPYGDKANIMVSRDGLLTIAHRSGMFNGMSTTFGYDKNGLLVHAETTVYNKSMQYPIICRVFMKEYSTGQNLWRTKPHIMLQKVAEATALRRAFNINGVYTPEEFEEAKVHIVEPNLPPQETSVVEPELPKGNPEQAMLQIDKAQTEGELNHYKKVIVEERSWKKEELQWLLERIDKRVAEFKNNLVTKIFTEKA
jgi:phage recombination protein Bet